MSEFVYEDRKVRPEFYPIDDFDPKNYLRPSVNEEGQQEMILDTKVKRFWFRLVYPTGKISTCVERLTDTLAVMRARIYKDVADPEEAFLAEASATRYFSNAVDSKPYQQYYLDWAETVAIGRALTNAGFELPPATSEQFGIDPVTGEIITGTPVASGAALPAQQAGAPVPVVPMPPAQVQQPRQYSQVTAPPAEQPALAPTAPPSAPAPRQSISAPKTVEEIMAGMTLESAKSVIVNFGPSSCRGHSIGEIASSDPKVLIWIAERYMGPDNSARAAAQFLIKQAG